MTDDGTHAALQEGRAASSYTVAQILENRARLSPDRPAVVQGDRHVTFAELNRDANRFARAIASWGLNPGDRLGVLSENRYEYVVAFYAAAKLGVIMALYNWRSSPDEVAWCLDLSEPSAVLVSERYRSLYREGSSLSSIREPYELTLGDVADDGPADEFVRAVRGSDDTDLASRHVDAEAILTLINTSGTTGRAKAAAVSHRALVARATHYSRQQGFGPDESFVCWAPMCHITSSDGIFNTHAHGGTAIVVDGYDPAVIAEIVCTQRIGWLPLVPGAIDSFVDAVAALAPRRPDLAVVGGMPDLLPPATVARLTRVVDAPFMNTFGATETGLVASTRMPVGVHPAQEDYEKPISDLVDWRIIEPDDPELEWVSPGGVGELVLRGSFLFSGYWGDAAASAEAFRGGWYHTGDLFLLCDNFHIQWVGRSKYLIKSGGENIYPSEIERLLLEVPAVAEALVVKVPNARWGEVPWAFVALDEGNQPDAEELLAHCSRRLPRFKLPKRIEFVSLSEFSRNATGKVLRSEFEQRALEILGRQEAMEPKTDTPTPEAQTEVHGT